jgi:hypothetical protein
MSFPRFFVGNLKTKNWIPDYPGISEFGNDIMMKNAIYRENADSLMLLAQACKLFFI